MSEWNWDTLLAAEPPPREPPDPLGSAVGQVLTVRQSEHVTHNGAQGRRWTGTLRRPADEAHRELQPLFAKQGFTALLQPAEAGDEVIVTAAPGVIQASTSRLWLALLLFALTLLSTFVTGAQEGTPQCTLLWNWRSGLVYSASIMSILLAHELGHFIASRRLGVAASYPFFIPLPFLSPFGTMGAVIAMKAMPPDRRALFTIGVAGPLAGLALAIPLTLLGLSLSTAGPFPTACGYILEGNSLLYGAMKWLVFQEWLPAGGRDVLLHPIAWAGWAGLLVTMLNLLPAGQLDGGHVAFALLGRRRAQQLTYIVVGLLLAFGFVWSGWWLWALLIGLMSNRSAPILNEVTALTPRQRGVAVLTLLLFVLLFTPTPLTAIPAP